MAGQLELDWNKYIELCNKLSTKIKKNCYNNLFLIGTGGWVVGKIVNKNLKLPISTLICKSYYEKKQYNFQISQIIPDLDLYGEVLLIDDLTDTGNTILSVTKILMKKYKEIRKIDTGVLIKKSNTVVSPDYFIIETDDWVIFPYE